MRYFLILILLLFLGCTTDTVDTPETKTACQPHCWSEPHNENCWQITPDGAYKHCPTPPGCNDKDQ